MPKPLLQGQALQKNPDSYLLRPAVRLQGREDQIRAIRRLNRRGATQPKFLQFRKKGLYETIPVRPAVYRYNSGPAARGFPTGADGYRFHTESHSSRLRGG